MECNICNGKIVEGDYFGIENGVRFHWKCWNEPYDRHYKGLAKRTQERIKEGFLKKSSTALDNSCPVCKTYKYLHFPQARSRGFEHSTCYGCVIDSLSVGKQMVKVNVMEMNIKGRPL